MLGQAGRMRHAGGAGAVSTGNWHAVASYGAALVPGSRGPRYDALRSAWGRPAWGRRERKMAAGALERLDRAAGLGVEHAPADQFLGEVGR